MSTVGIEEIHGYDITIRAFEDYIKRLKNYAESDEVKDFPAILRNKIEEYAEKTIPFSENLVASARTKRSMGESYDVRPLFITVIFLYIKKLEKSIEKSGKYVDGENLRPVKAELSAAHALVREWLPGSQIPEQDPYLVVDYKDYLPSQ